MAPGVGPGTDGNREAHYLCPEEEKTYKIRQHLQIPPRARPLQVIP